MLMLASLLLGLHGPSEAASEPDGQSDTATAGASLMVIGDSLARAFNDTPGSPRQGFWSMVAREVGATPHLAAQGGSGFVKPGLARCKGRTFLEQLQRPLVRQRVIEAEAVIIEGGRNDTRTCAGHGNFAEVTAAQLLRAVNTFMHELQLLRGKDDCTIVITPWGPKGPDERERVTPVIREAARSHGFDFVDTVGLLNGKNAAADGVHPTRSGNIALTRTLLRRSYVRACMY